MQSESSLEALRSKVRLLLDDRGKEVFSLQEKLNDIQTRYQRELKLRRELHNSLIELKGNIRVFCRIRPFLPSDESHEPCLNLIDSESLIVDARFKNGKPKKFEFDNIFSAKATQEEVFAEVRPLITSVLDGYNVCVIAYGQTGMCGNYIIRFT